MTIYSGRPKGKPQGKILFPSYDRVRVSPRWARKDNKQNGGDDASITRQSLSCFIKRILTYFVHLKRSAWELVHRAAVNDCCSIADWPFPFKVSFDCLRSNRMERQEVVFDVGIWQSNRSDDRDISSNDKYLSQFIFHIGHIDRSTKTCLVGVDIERNSCQDRKRRKRKRSSSNYVHAPTALDGRWRAHFGDGRDIISWLGWGQP